MLDTNIMTCHYCDRKLDEVLIPTKDHKIPTIKGGLSISENIVVSCKPCNQIKSDRDYDEFYFFFRLWLALENGGEYRANAFDFKSMQPYQKAFDKWWWRSFHF